MSHNFANSNEKFTMDTIEDLKKKKYIPSGKAVNDAVVMNPCKI